MRDGTAYKVGVYYAGSLTLAHIRTLLVRAAEFREGKWELKKMGAGVNHIEKSKRCTVESASEG